MRTLLLLLASVSFAIGQYSARSYCTDSGSTDTYVCSFNLSPVAYVAGNAYRFKANTANTGTASINFNSIGAKTIVIAAGGVTTTLSDNAIRAGQIVDLIYDGTNMQMQSTSGIAPVVPSAYWSSVNGTGGYITGNTAATANTTRCMATYTAVPVIFGHLLFSVGTADNSNASDVGVYNSAGTLVADTGAFTSATTGVRTIANAQGTVTMPAGKVYICLTSVGSTFSIGLINLGFSIFPIGSVSSATSGGALNGSFTPPADAPGLGNSGPFVMLAP